MRVAIIRLSSLGDVILVSSLLSYLGEKRADDEITLITAERFVPLFSGDCRLRNVIGVCTPGHGLPASFRHRAFDVVIDLQNNRYSRRIRKTAVNGRMTRVMNKRYFERMVLLVFRLNTYPRFDHVVLRYIRAAGGSPRGWDEVPSPALSAGNYPFPAAVDMERGRRYLALFPFSAWRNKEWPCDCFRAVAVHFIRRGWHVLIFGSSAERERGKELCGRIGTGSRSLAGSTTPQQAAAVIARCGAACGNDTGLSHLARACGVKTGILAGPTTVHLGFFPFGVPPFQLFEYPLFCRPCHAHGGSICMRGSHACMRRIGPRQVIEGMERLIASPDGSGTASCSGSPPGTRPARGLT